jgi:hypothetical protein
LKDSGSLSRWNCFSRKFAAGHSINRSGDIEGALMRVHRLRLTGLDIGQSSEAPRVEPARREAKEELAAADAALHTPSPELRQWTAQAGQEPEIRAQAVAHASQRLAEGGYLTDQTAEQTAHAMLTSLESA